MTTIRRRRQQQVFGPVPTRRLGRSLGVDPVPLKTCNFNCVYCQLGRTTRLSTRRKAFFNVCEVLAEVVTTVADRGTDAIDWITFVGSGETALFSRLGSLIRYVQTATRLPVAVITNGSLLSVPAVRRELAAADAVLPSLDAGSEDLYLRINRPHRSFTFADHIRGLREFRNEYGGRLWIEVMLVSGVNDSEDAVTDLASLLHGIGADEVHLTLPDRPPSEPWVEAPEPAIVARARELIGSTARVPEPDSIGDVLEPGGDIAGATAAVLTRHPMREAELVHLLGRWAPGRALAILTELGERRDLQVVERGGDRYWCDAHSVYSGVVTNSDNRRHTGPAA